MSRGHTHFKIYEVVDPVRNNEKVVFLAISIIDLSPQITFIYKQTSEQKQKSRNDVIEAKLNILKRVVTFF